MGQAERQAKWYRKHRKRLLDERKRQRVEQPEKARKHTRTRKKKIMTMYGGECIFCHTSELAVLTLDHVNDDGAAERKRTKLSGDNFYKKLLQAPRRDDLQVLCASCQQRKRIYGPDLSNWHFREEIPEESKQPDPKWLENLTPLGWGLYRIKTA